MKPIHSLAATLVILSADMAQGCAGVKRATLSALLFVALVGCGGGGSSTPSPFVGTWLDNTNGNNASVTIGSDGRFTGTSADTNGGTDTLTGLITNAGSVSGTATNSIDIGVTLSLGGNVALSTSTTLTYTLSAHNPQTNQTSSGSGTMTKQ